jgi:predicted nucleic acid-binding protein
VIVVDASALIDVLLRTEAGLRIEGQLFDGANSLHAPYLIDLEIAQVLRRYWASGQLAPDRARQALDDFADLRLRRWPHDPLLRRIWALRANLSAYDAAYVALAEALDAPLLTRDRRLAAAPGHRANVRLA